MNLAANEQNIKISVVYPDSSKRAEVLYKTIIKGMSFNKSITLSVHPFSAKQDALAIQQLIINDQSALLVLLGTKAVNLRHQFSLNIPIITGAHMLIKNNQLGISLSADPQQLFSQLKTVQPMIKKVNVIYSEENNGWLIEYAKIAAKSYNIEVNAIQSQKIQNSGAELKKIIKQIDAKTEAIWLPYDPIVPTKKLLPELLKNAWNKNLLVFSGNPYHVQQGTLFALFPNYNQLGKQLVELSLQSLNQKYRLNQQSNLAPQPSKYLNSAINIRTASHLGIHLSNEEKENYQMIFPKN